MKIYNLKKKILGALSLFIIINFTLLIINSPVHAQEISLSISPPLTEITIQPGKVFSQTFTVKNNGTPVVIIPKIFPFIPLDRQGHAELVEDQGSINAFSGWFAFDPSPISLGTTGSHDFIVKITPPAQVEEKDYYFTFIAEVQNDNNLGVSASLSQTRIGANLLTTISKDGNPQKKASIFEFSAPKFIDSFSPLIYKIVLRNSGFGFFKPIGQITVNQIFGPTTVLKLAPLNILVGGSREITCVQGEELVSCKLPGKFLIGIYRADLSFTIDGSGESIGKQINTIAFPFSVTLGLALIFISYRLIRKATS